MVLRGELQMAQMYTHTWGFVAILMLIAMSIQASRFADPKAPIAVLSVFAVLVAVATALSMAMHDDYDKDGTLQHDALGDAETGSVVLAMVYGVLAFLVVWLLEPSRPFAVSPTFPYLLFGLCGSAAAMGYLYFRGAGFTALHREVVQQRGGKEGWSHRLEQWAFYHAMWHQVGGCFLFILVLLLWIALRGRFDQ